MLITKVDSVYEVALPADVRLFLSYLSFAISIGLSDSSISAQTGLEPSYCGAPAH